MSLRNYLAEEAIQHIGVNVDDMQLSKEFYINILGGVFIAEITGIDGEEWTTILNADVKTAPQLGAGDALDVCFISFGNSAVELLRYYNKESGLTHNANVSVDANEQGVAGKHISFNLAADISTKDFFDKLCDATASMTCVSLNKGDVHQLGPDGPLGGWNCFFMSGPNGERIEFNQIPKGRCKLLKSRRAFSKSSLLKLTSTLATPRAPAKGLMGNGQGRLSFSRSNF